MRTERCQKRSGNRVEMYRRMFPEVDLGVSADDGQNTLFELGVLMYP